MARYIYLYPREIDFPGHWIGGMVSSVFSSRLCEDELFGRNSIVRSVDFPTCFSYEPPVVFSAELPVVTIIPLIPIQCLVAFPLVVVIGIITKV
jgi:hypothetical protein